MGFFIIFKSFARRLLWTSLFFAALIFSGCSSLLYYPTPQEYVDRAKMPIKPVDLTFASEDGTRLHGWIFHAPSQTATANSKAPPRGCVLLQFHGNAQNISTHFFSLYWILDHGYDYMTFDYHGYGSSEGKPSPKATVEDGHAALRKIHELYPDKKIVVLAQSLGGNIGTRSVIDMRKEIPVTLLFADSTFASYRSVARSTLSNHWLTWLFQPIGWLVMSDEYASKPVLQDLRTPLVVIHGEKDTVVDLSQGKDLFERAPKPKEFWPVEDVGHISALYKLSVQKRFLEKLETICK